MSANNRPGTVEDLAQLYRETIRRHAAQPVGHDASIDATHCHEEHNPFCGDRVKMLLRLDGDLVEAAAFEGEACAICMASASLLCQLVPGGPVARVSEWHAALSDALTGGGEGELAAELHPLLGVKPYPSRQKCAELPWIAAVRALETDPQAA